MLLKSKTTITGEEVVNFIGNMREENQSYDWIIEFVLIQPCTSQSMYVAAFLL